ncbi:MAG: hypothetical protein HY077_15500 [Elusimicrobia bacterium]|nr:hypothetical protein [Elusimicrobiota bacterium]
MPNRSIHKRLAGPWIAAIAFVLLWLSAISLPHRAVDASLDDSWQSVLVDSLARHRRFGIDIVLNHGPLGLLRADYYAGGPLAARALWELAAKGALALFVLLAIGRLKDRRLQAAALLASCVLCLVDFDTMYYFIAFSLGALLLEDGPQNVPLNLAATAALAAISLIKLNFAMLAGAAVCLAAIRAWLDKDLRRAAPAAAFPVFVLAAWSASGQSLADFPAFLRNSWDLVSGYNGAMGLSESWTTFGLGLTTLVCALSALAASPREPRSLPRLAFCAAAFFLVWKTGYVRADHAPTYFRFCMLTGLWLWGGGLLRPKRRLALICAAVTIAAGLVGLMRWELLSGEATLGAWPGRIARSALDVISLPSLERRLESSLAEQKAAAALPRTSASIGNGSVDLFGNEAGIVLMNGWDYRPRPCFHSHGAYTPLLERMNADFYAGPDAPDFVLAKPGSAVDWHFSAQEDGLALRALLERYRPVLAEGPTVLLKRGATLTPKPDALLSVAGAAFGSEIAVPKGTLWALITVEPTWLGRLRAFLYKPPLITMKVKSKEGSKDFHFVPAAAKEGFLLSPLLETPQDWLALYSGRAAREVESFSLSIPAGTALFYQSGFLVELRRPRLAKEL